jgi:hypothetical protein
MSTVLGAIALIVGLAGAAYAFYGFRQNTRHVNADLMGASIHFDATWMPAALFAAAGLTLLFQLAWPWGVGLFILLAVGGTLVKWRLSSR